MAEYRRKTVAKLVLGGDGGVGKTTLIHRYIDGEYLEGKITIGSDFRVKELSNGKHYLLQIWDLGGQDQFRFILPNYCRGSNFGFLCFAINDRKSFENLDEWYNMFIENAPKIKILLLAMKCDLTRGVDRSEIQVYITQRNILGYFETSSKDNFGIQNAFQALLMI